MGSKSVVTKMLIKTEKWCEENHLSINKDKSSIIQIRADLRTKDTTTKSVRGIKVVN